MAVGIAYGWQVENANGTPVSGAKVFFKIKGTSTNATTYTDSALTVPAANPVLADAAGWFATYLSPTVNYDIQIKSADESITYQSTSVSPSATGSQPVDATLTALAGAGFENRKFPRGSGPDTVQNVTISEATNVFTTDDYSNSIASAITAAGAGGTVFIPEGSYTITATITPLDNQRIIFGGPGVTVTMNSAVVAKMFDLTSKTRVRLEFNGATLDGNKDVTPSGVMIDMHDSVSCYLGPAKIIDAPTGTYGAIEISGVADGNILDHLEGYDCEGTFISVSGEASGETVTNTEIISPYVEDAALFGIRVGLATDVTIYKPRCTSNGIEMVGVTVFGKRVKVIEPDISGCGDNAISFSGNDNSCVGGELSGNQKAGIWCWGSNNRVVGTKASNNNLENAGNNWAGFGASANFGGCGQNNQFIACLADDTQGSPTQWNGVRFAGLAYPQWLTGTSYTSGTSYVYNGLNIYLATTTGTSGATAPTHTSGTVSDGTVSWRYVNTFVGVAGATGNAADVRTIRFASSAYFDADSLLRNRNLRNESLRIIESLAGQVSLTGSTSETPLRSETIPADTLGANGIIRLRAYGTLTGAAGNKTIRLKFGSTTILTQPYTAGSTWLIDMQCSNVAATGTQRWFGQINRAGDALTQIVSGSSSEDTTTDIVLDVTGQLAGGADTITIQGFTVEVAFRA